MQLAEFFDDARQIDKALNKRKEAEAPKVPLRNRVQEVLPDLPEAERLFWEEQEPDEQSSASIVLLSPLRDHLWPMAMAGEISLKDAQRICAAEEAYPGNLTMEQHLWCLKDNPQKSYPQRIRQWLRDVADPDRFMELVDAGTAPHEAAEILIAERSTP